MSASQIATVINSALPSLKSGSLRFWGNWFGRPYDNWHRLLRCEANSETVILSFNEGEVLVITNPFEVVIDIDRFSIREASSVRWEWFCYGLPKTIENRRFQEYVCDGKSTAFNTNSDADSRDPNLSASANAVEFL